MTTNNIMDFGIDEVKQDRKRIGNYSYRGIAYFGWNQAYKHTMRELSRHARKEIHDALLLNGLAFNSVSDSISQMIAEVAAEDRAKNQAVDAKIAVWGEIPVTSITL